MEHGLGHRPHRHRQLPRRPGRGPLGATLSLDRTHQDTIPASIGVSAIEADEALALIAAKREISVTAGLERLLESLE